MKDRIKAVRKGADLTQTAFGEKIGLSQNYIALIEAGQRNPSDRAIRDICREFSVNEVWLRTGVGEMQSPAGREEEMARMIRSLMSDRPDSFRSALITALLRFDPGGPEWSALERIFESVKSEIEKAPGR